MATWRVSTKYAKCVEVHEIWSKDSTKIRMVEAFRTGSWIVETENDDPPVFKLTQLPLGDDEVDSIDMFNNGYVTELEEIFDGWYGTWDFPAGFDASEAEAIEEGWHSDGYTFMQDNQWLFNETEHWICGEIEIEKID